MVPTVGLNVFNSVQCLGLTVFSSVSYSSIIWDNEIVYLCGDLVQLARAHTHESYSRTDRSSFGEFL